MRGDNIDQVGVFSYISPEARVPQGHPLRAIRQMVDGGPDSSNGGPNCLMFT